MKPFTKSLLAALIIFTLLSCKRRHIYCTCDLSPAGGGKAEDWGTRNSIDNFRKWDTKCKNYEKQGYTDCKIIAE